MKDTSVLYLKAEFGSMEGVSSVKGKLNGRCGVNR